MLKFSHKNVFLKKNKKIYKNIQEYLNHQQQRAKFQI
jgi:hypothetical protein